MHSGFIVLPTWHTRVLCVLPKTLYLILCFFVNYISKIIVVVRNNIVYWLHTFFRIPILSYKFVCIPPEELFTLSKSAEQFLIMKKKGTNVFSHLFPSYSHALCGFFYTFTSSFNQANASSKVAK